MILIKILAAIFIFGMIIIIHELGHFILAISMGVKVNEFSFGMGPRLFTIHGKVTDYSLKLLPIGGSCEMKGELEDETGDNDTFLAKKPWQRFLIVFAGPAFNFILAFIVAIVLVISLGSDRPIVGQVMDGYPAQEAGIMEGDEIIRINNRNIHLYREISVYTAIHDGQPMNITVKRGDSKYTCYIEPKYDEESGRKLIGMYSVGVAKFPTNVFQTIKYAYYEVRYNILLAIDSIVYLLNGHFNKDSVMGPVGIVDNISDTVEEAAPYGLKILLLTIADYILLFSSNLGVMNLLPIPALDGGRLLFIIYEMIFRKPVDRKVESIIHMIGFAILMALMLYIAFNDIMRII